MDVWYFEPRAAPNRVILDLQKRPLKALQPIDQKHCQEDVPIMYRWQSLAVFVLVILIPTSVAEESRKSRKVTTETTPEITASCDAGLEACVAEKRAEYRNRGTIGILFAPPEKDSTIPGGIRWIVAKVLPNGAGDEAGLLAEDLVLRWNGESPQLGKEFQDQLFERIRAGEQIEIEVLRDGEQHRLDLKAKPPDARTMEYWLMYYVHDNYGEEEFRAYEAEVLKRMGG